MKPQNSDPARRLLRWEVAYTRRLLRDETWPVAVMRRAVRLEMAKSRPRLRTVEALTTAIERAKRVAIIL